MNKDKKAKRFAKTLKNTKKRKLFKNEKKRFLLCLNSISQHFNCKTKNIENCLPSKCQFIKTKKRKYCRRKRINKTLKRKL